MMPVRHRTFFPPSPLFCGGPECFRGTTNEPQAARLPLQRLAQWEVVSSYSSATAPDSHGISCADPLFQARKELDREVAACAPRCKNYLINPPTNVSCVIDWLSFKPYRHRRRWFHRLQSHSGFAG